MTRKGAIFGGPFVALGLVVGLVAPSPVWAATVNVAMEDSFFTPDPITVTTADTIRWTNNVGFVHTAQADGLFNSGDVAPGGTFELPLTDIAPGTYDYYCLYHGSAGSDFGMVGTITVDPAPGGSSKLTVGDVKVTEGNGGSVKAFFPVRLSSAAASTVTVNYATQNGSAVQPGDYTQASGSLTFNPGQTFKNVPVVLKGGTVDESNETFSLKLTNASGATIADGTGVGTIVDNDPNGGALDLALGDVTVTEGDGGTAKVLFTVRLSKASTGTVSVAYATANNTATAPSDFAATSGTLSFSAGQTSKTVTVTVKGGTGDEPNEAFRVNLSSPSGATILDGQGVGTIRDDD